MWLFHTVNIRQIVTQNPRFSYLSREMLVAKSWLTSQNDRQTWFTMGFLKYVCPSDNRMCLQNAIFCVFGPHTCFFLYEQGFFSTQPLCCLICSWIELQMLLNIYKHHHSDIDTFYIYHMSWSRITYVVSMWSIFHCHLHFHND